MEERTGKSLTALLICEATKAEKVLVVTKKKALAGWQDTLNQAKQLKKSYVLTNYESLHKLKKEPFDIAIVDEAHSKISGYPKPSKTCKLLQSYVYHSAIVFCSATPSFQSFSRLFHQMAITKFSPFDVFKNFYRWFEVFGVPRTKHIYGKAVADYSVCNEQKINEATKHLFISYTRKELGFEHEPDDVIHYVEPSSELRKVYNELRTSSVLLQPLYKADTAPKFLKALHQIEGSTLKISETSRHIFDFKDKCEYIEANFKNYASIGIFYEYIGEKFLLENYFKNDKRVSIYQSSSFAEGVDLSHIEVLIVYSMGFSTSQFVQRRARQCNMQRTTPIKVHFLLVKGGVSEQVYNTVARNKKNFSMHYFANTGV